MYRLPIIPEEVVVHLGEPNSPARNLTVPFVEYIKNVASGELYPNWPEQALRANIYAIISFTLNRIYNEWYRSQGYDFDITSSPKYDQSFVENRQFFERIYVIVDEIFNSYIVRNNQVQPLFASYCDGKTSTCSGLSQWGSATLASKGLSALDILKYYYGSDIKIVSNATIEDIGLSYPGYIIRLGDAGDYIKELKIELNRIGRNYPAIPAITDSSIYFNVELEKAVKVFQNTFNLPVTGEINNATWNKIRYLYNAVKKIASLYSEGISLKEVELSFPNKLKSGDTGNYIKELNYYLNVIALYNTNIPYHLEGNVYTEETASNVKALQKEYNLEENGIVDAKTWKVIKEVYKKTIDSVPKKCYYCLNEFFPGRYLTLGMVGDDVINLQRLLFLICKSKNIISGVLISGEYDSLTRKSVTELQTKNNLPTTGVVTAETWKVIVEESK